MRPETNAVQTPPETVIDHYAIDAKASNFVVQAFATGLLSAFGHSPKIAIRDFAGEVQFSRENGMLQDVRLRVSIRADSLEVIDKISDKDRDEIQRQMFQNVLETDRFPVIVYECSQLTVNGTGVRLWATLNGQLTMHGVTQSLPVTARAVLNDDSLRASGEFTVRQSDFDISPVSAAAGTIKLKDELKLTFDIAARKD